MDAVREPPQKYEELQLFFESMPFGFFIDTGFANRGEYTSTPHSHDHYELFYCAKGGADIGYDEGVIRLGVGDIGIVPPQISHHIHTARDTLYILISFWDNEKMWDTDQIQFLHHLPVSDAFKRMTDYYFGNYQYKKTLLCACLSEIWAILMEYHQNPLSKNAQPANIDTELYRRYVISNYFSSYCSENPNLPELAQMLHLSVHQTQRAIHKIYGCSFQNRLNFLRMDKAKTLLAQTDLPIGKISTAVGYKSVQGFLTVFKKVIGMTPTTYRKNNR